MNPEQAERIGGLYGQALSNFDDFGDFQMALTNSMTYHRCHWDMDEFEEVLSAFVDAEVSTNPPYYGKRKIK